MGIMAKLFGAKKAVPEKNAEPNKATVHFFYGRNQPIDAESLKPMVREISKQEDLPDSCLYLYQVNPWPPAIKEYALKLIREAGRYPNGNVGIFESQGEFSGAFEGVPFACLTLVGDIEIKTMAVNDVPADLRKALGL